MTEQQAQEIINLLKQILQELRDFRAEVARME
jgi:hypothetical protein